MKTIMFKAAALAGLAALVPVSLALSANAAEASDTVPAEAIVSETEDGLTVITKTITVTDDETEDCEETVYYCCDEDDLAESGSFSSSGEEGMCFLFGNTELDTENIGSEPAEGSYTVLTLAEADALAQEKLTGEQYARWAELTVMMQEPGFAEDAENNALFEEMTTLLAEMSGSDTKWNGISYTSQCGGDENEVIGFCSISDGTDDGILNTDDSVFIYETETE